MAGMAERYRELAPAAYLTLMSMIEAIALENLVARGQEIGATLAFGASGVAVWLAWLLTLQVIVTTWVTNAQGFMSFRWRPGHEDFLIPFVGGLVQFVLIGWIGEAGLARFMMLAGSLSLGMAVVVAWLFSYENEDMAEFVGEFWTPGLYASAGVGGLLGFAGGWLHFLGIVGPGFAAGVLAVVNALSVAFLAIWLRAWARCVIPAEAA